MDRINKELLIISWGMPPMLYPRSIQVSRLTKGLSKLGWQCTVISADPHFSSYYYDNYEDLLLDTLYNKYYTRLQVPENNETKIPIEGLFLRWYQPAIDSIEQLIKDNNYSALLTFGQPWVDHLIGLYIKSKYGLPWIAHFSDPWIDSIYYENKDELITEIWKSLEKLVILTADKIVFTNKQALDTVMSKYPSSWLTRTCFIAHSFDNDLLKKIKPKSEIQEKLTIIHSGSLTEKRNPYSLLEAIKKIVKQNQTLMNRFEVVLLGFVAGSIKKKINEIGLSKIVKTHDRVSYLDSMQFIMSADVLLVIEAANDKNNPFLPSKLIDYLMFDKPILGLTPKNGATAELLTRLNYPIVEPNDVEGIEKILINLIYSWQDEKMKLPPHHQNVAKEFELNRISHQWDEIIMSLLECEIKNHTDNVKAEVLSLEKDKEYFNPQQKSSENIHIGDKHYNLDILNSLLSILISAEQTSQKVAEKESLFQQMRSLLSLYAIKGKNGLKRVTLKRSFTHYGGFMWSIPCPEIQHLADNEKNPQQSPLILFENATPLGPSHTLHHDIYTWGSGRYSHWGDYLYFSTSDNTDPNTNGRTYTILYPNDEKNKRFLFFKHIVV